MASNQVVLGNASVTDVYLGSATANATTHESSAVVINPTATTGSSTLYLGYDNSGTYTGAHTSATTTKLQVYGGQSQTLNTGIGWFTNAGVRIGSLPTDAVGHGIILTDSAGACWQIVPSSTTGFVTSTSVTCP